MSYAQTILRTAKIVRGRRRRRRNCYTGGRSMATLPTAHNLTGILRQIGSNDSKEASSAMEFIYSHLRGLAAKVLRREFLRSTVTPTDLLHEVYVRHLHRRSMRIQDRGHFFAVVVKLMQQVMADHARRRDAAKRGKGLVFVPLEAYAARRAGRASGEQAFMIDHCFKRLSDLDPGVARVIELRHLFGYTVRETAELLAQPEWRVREDSDFGEVWLLDQLGFSSDARSAPKLRAS
jgi:RNA polymerase sigma factor (TIGR02999 family)